MYSEYHLFLFNLFLRRMARDMAFCDPFEKVYHNNKRYEITKIQFQGLSILITVLAPYTIDSIYGGTIWHDTAQSILNSKENFGQTRISQKTPMPVSRELLGANRPRYIRSTLRGLHIHWYIQLGVPIAVACHVTLKKVVRFDIFPVWFHVSFELK